MKLKIIRIFIFLLVLTLPLNLLGNDLIGYRHEGVRYGEKLPNGVRDLGGGLLSDEDYGVTRFKKGSVYMLWLERIISRNQSGVPLWEVRAVLKFEKLGKNQRFLYSYSSPCLINGGENLDLIVLAQVSPRSKVIIPLKAWIVDVMAEEFRKIPVGGISCQ